jgi:flagellar protein FliS
MIEGDVYLKNNVEGMNNDELILFIYQEMMKILNQAIYFFEQNEIEQRVNAINKAIEVTNALMSILNFDQGGDIAVRLRSLYLYSIKKLTTANYEKDPAAVGEVAKIFKDLYSGWSEKIEKDKQANAAAAAPYPGPPQGMGSNGSGPAPGSGVGGLEIYG